VNLFILPIRDENFLLIFRESILSCETRKPATDWKIRATVGVTVDVGCDRVTHTPLLFRQSFATNGKFSELSLRCLLGIITV
jgi:hypothetical protein